MQDREYGRLSGGKQTHQYGSVKLRRAALSGLAELGPRGEFHLERRSFARRRHHPDAAAVHLHDLLGDGEAEARAAFSLGKRAVDLMELIEDPILLVEWYSRASVRYRDGEMAIPRARGDAHLARVGELDGVWQIRTRQQAPRCALHCRDGAKSRRSLGVSQIWSDGDSSSALSRAWLL